MADTKITALAAITTVDPAADVLPIVDISDTSMAASGTTKKITTNQILGSGGTATLASATISGDLTVNTNVLKVDSTNDRVIVGHTSGSSAFQVTNAGAAGLEIQPTGFSSSPLILSYNRSGSAYTQLTLDGSTIVHALSGSTAMTLNSTGLGIGASPANYGATFRTLAVNATDAGILDLMSNSVSQFRLFGNGLENRLGGITNVPMTFYTNNTERARIDASGNVGVGVTPSAWGSNSKALHVGGGSASVSSTGAGSTASRFAHGAYFDNTNWLYQYTGVGPALYQVTGANAGSTHAWYIAPGGTAGNAITFTQAMTLVASGDLGVGTTNPASDFGTVRSGFVATGASGAIGAKVDATGRACLIAWNADTAGDNNFVQFFTEAALTTRGSISYNRAGGLVAYNTTSDYRAKDIIGPVSSSGSLIDSLKVYVGKMKGATIERPMLIAHEAQEVAPYAVTGTKDEVDADGNPKYQQMDVSSFVPLLIAEIQSLRTRVQTLEAK